MNSDNDPIPFSEVYREVGIHENQSPARIALVKKEIDTVLAERRIDVLVAWAGDPGRSPESRMAAETMVLALFQLAAESRVERPDVDLERLSASTAGLGILMWQHPTHYASMFDHSDPGFDRAVEREVPLPWDHKVRSPEDAP